nr:hypothetical protein B0A51_00784 [Rachicladosporium sp. CCFEE 5018]
MLLQRPTRAAIAILFFLTLVCIYLYSQSFSEAFHPTRDYYMSPASWKKYQQWDNNDHNEAMMHISLPDMCKDIGLKRHWNSVHEPRRKVYDLVMFSTELDWLEIRLNEHRIYVDYFVIIESPTTFSGQPKPLVLKENWDRFKPFHDRIIYRVVEDPITSTRIWDHKDYLRNALLYSVFPTLTDPAQKANPGDVLIVSDMDELLRHGTLLALKYCTIPARLTLRSQFYYYSFEWKHRGEQWAYPEATVFRSSVLDTIAPNNLRMNLLSPGFRPLAAYRRWRDHATLWDAGWHCSSCFRTIREVQTKMQSFSHQGWNTPENRDARRIAERVRKGEDLFGREGERYEKVDPFMDMPFYVRHMYMEGPEDARIKYLVNRTGKDAGFEDYDETVDGAG